MFLFLIARFVGSEKIMCEKKIKIHIHCSMKNIRRKDILFYHSNIFVDKFNL